MTQTEILIVNFEEIRRRSIKLWTGIPPGNYFWKPDSAAISCLEMVRHVLEAEHLFHIIVERRGNIGNYISPWENRAYTNLQDELNFAASFREKFLHAVKDFTPEELSSIEIIRSEKG